MEYLRIKRLKSQVRADGSRFAVPIVVTKSAKYGERLNEKTISVKRPVLLTGEPNSGKTRWLTRLHEHAEEIWGTKSKAAPLLLGARSSLDSWCNAPVVKQWWEQQQQAYPVTQRSDWSSVKQSKRIALMATYLKNTGAVLLIDDAHKLSGPPLRVALKCVQAAQIWLVAAYKTQHISPTLLAALTHREPQCFQLRG